MDLLILTLSFGFVALAAQQFGKAATRLGLPKITGYLLAGIIAGPFVLGLMPTGSTDTLRYIDELALGVIAFVAGSELYLKEIRGRIRSIGWITGGVVLTASFAIGLALFALTWFIPFTQDAPLVTRIAIALLGATVLLALSPASTIAVIQEARAKGTFTRTVLGVTVTMDVVIILLFAVSVAVAGALLGGDSFDQGFILLLLVDIGAAVLLGVITGKLLQWILGRSMRRWLKATAVLVIGYALFWGSYELLGLSRELLPFEIHVEALLAAMIAGFFVTNYTTHRDEFAQILHDISPWVYVAFFTLTGVALKLDILLTALPIALALFVVRAVGIGIGSLGGNALAGEPRRNGRYLWMGLITQAGIALGLAREVAVEFPLLGDNFATLIIAVVVLNEVAGPILFKIALQRVGDARIPQHMQPDEIRNAVILGIEEQSLELARQLRAGGWQVVLADTDRSHVARLIDTKFEAYYLTALDEDSLKPLFGPGTDALISLLPDDEANLEACELAHQLGIRRLVVRPHDLKYLEAFGSLGALVVDPASAMVHLLGQAVRSPQTTAVLLHQDSGREMVQVTVNNADVDGMLLRELRLPEDLLFLDVTRNGHSLVPNGYTRIKLDDEVTMLGKAHSLEEATLKLGF